jgi:hypothetical protein
VNLIFGMTYAGNRTYFWMTAGILEASSHLRTRRRLVELGNELVNLLFVMSYGEDMSYF